MTNNSTTEQMTKQFYEIYEQLTPENKQKVIAKYYELLAEQEREQSGEDSGHD